MKVHYINILLFTLPLNILAHNKNKPSITLPTSHTPTARLLCECDLYMPNYDNDSEMKEVMQQFEDRTTQRFQEYDDRMKTTRQKCKEQCDKEIQKIILKDKLEKQMAEQFATLKTDIQSDAIPTCICEKSLADKVEKGCLRCTQNLGGIVAPSSGVLAGIAEAALSVWKPAALKAAARYAIKEGAAKGLAAGDALGMNIVNTFLKGLDLQKLGIVEFNSFFTTKYYIDVPNVTTIISTKLNATCGANALSGSEVVCTPIRAKFGLLQKYGQLPPPDKIVIKNMLTEVNRKAALSATDQAAKVRSATTTAIKAEKTDLINTIFGTWDTAITASIIAIVVIVLIMVIIYLILRHRRKKKMKKKLQYIKLLEE
ncbi:rifin [Plasmodium reichenowi]|uniref:Rifin n=1 Tax=Plasmodium reichenowi TaxID=5854 RepID=A0A060RQC8_PLARE|nr:rifin [Plasmodium reichenowi]